MLAGGCVVCVALLLCVTSVTGQGEEEEEEFLMCEEACDRYQDWGEKCVVESGCPHMSADDKAACHDRCLSVFEQCQTLCLQNYRPINDTCEYQCQNSSIMDVFCDVECFGEQLATHYMKGVPELKPEQIIEVVEGPPLLSSSSSSSSPFSEEEEDEGGDSSEVEDSLEDEDSSMEELFNELEHELSEDGASSEGEDIDQLDNDDFQSSR